MVFVSAKAPEAAAMMRPITSFLMALIASIRALAPNVSRVLEDCRKTLWTGRKASRSSRCSQGQQLEISSRAAWSNGFWIPRARTAAVLSFPTCFS